VIVSLPPSNFDDSGYYVRGSKVYYHRGFPGEPFVVPNVDIDSFIIIDSEYAQDKTYVYLHGAILPGADPDSFEIFDNTFTRDANRVYLQDQVFSEDAAHFEYVTRIIYRDSHHIYWSTSTISDDPENLIILGDEGFYTFFKDSTTVFINGGPIEGADPATFTLLREAYSRDASNIFYFTSIIFGADMSTFEIIETPYARDASHVYFMENVLPDADPATFIVLNIDFQCSADATHAYYQGDLILGFDPTIIPAGATVGSCDGTQIYFYP
jgi:hypothetical protein